jgi:small subunit ribosomal protein S20
MPNIKQQKKRVRIASEERVENLRYVSTVKTFTRRLRSAVDAGDQDRIAEEHRTLVRWIDKAAARGGPSPQRGGPEEVPGGEAPPPAPRTRPAPRPPRG